MKYNNIKQKGLALFLALIIGWSATKAHAQDVFFTADVTSKITANNVAGGLSHLDNGDILAFTVDYFNGPSLVIIDANQDNIPAGGTKILAQFDSSTYADFVQVSPNGKFALAGVSGSSSNIYKIDLSSETVSNYFSAPGNYDLVFIDNDKAYLSSSPGGFDPLQPNQISLVTLGNTPTITAVANISNTPSGTIALNNSGDLYYLRSTWTYPPPLNANTLLKFSAASLAQAAISTPLSESDSSIAVSVDGGYDMVYHQLDSTNGEFYISTSNNIIYRVKETTLTPEIFLTVSDNPNTFPYMTGLSFFQPTATFGNSSVSQAELAISLATDFSSTYSLLQIRPTNWVKNFAKGLTPTIGSATGGKKTLRVVLEKFAESNVQYYVEIQGPSPKKSKKKHTITKGNTYTFKNLKAGTYKVKFYAKLKVNHKTLTTATSQTMTVVVS